MGLSVKWGSCNMGAVLPEESGDFYAWGELEPKSYYDWETYRWFDNESGSFTKYCFVPNSLGVKGPTDHLTVLESEDDIAAHKLKNQWRIPSISEWEELLNPENCIWVWEKSNGVNGYRVTSLKTNNSIFLPAAGFRHRHYFNLPDTCGFYWSSSLGTDHPAASWNVTFDEESKGRWIGYARCGGQSIRPVCD